MLKRGRPKGTKNVWDSRWHLPMKDRFWEKVDVRSESECWNWKAFIHPSGYGMFAINRKMYGAHRIAWELVNGKIPDGICVCHTCDNRICVNPSHLFLGSIKDNVDDRDNKNRGKVPHYDGGNRFNSKLTREDVLMIREMSKTGNSQRTIAEKFGLSGSYVSKIVSGKSFGWMK